MVHEFWINTVEAYRCVEDHGVRQASGWSRLVSTNSAPDKSLQPTAQPLRAWAAAELGRWAAQSAKLRRTPRTALVSTHLWYSVWVTHGRSPAATRAPMCPQLTTRHWPLQESQSCCQRVDQFEQRSPLEPEIPAPHRRPRSVENVAQESAPLARFLAAGGPAGLVA